MLRPLFAVMVMALMAGCGNAYQSLTWTPWQQVGSLEAPVHESKVKLRVSNLQEGQGAAVSPGDLVRIRIAAKDGLLEPYAYSRELPKPHEVWLWAGREPPLGSYDAFMAWGSPGSGRMRAALIGKRVGSRFDVQLDADSDYIVEIPLKGLTVHPGATASLHGEDQWPALHFSRASTIAQIEIVEACPGRMLRRSASVRQRGYILNMFDMSYRNVRSGSLTWSALEADCPGWADKVRLQIGPLYFSRGGGLYNWPTTYAELGQARYAWTLLGLSLPGYVAIGIVLGGAVYLRLTLKRRKQGR